MAKDRRIEYFGHLDLSTLTLVLITDIELAGPLQPTPQEKKIEARHRQFLHLKSDFCCRSRRFRQQIAHSKR
jgi:hypothetical protein